jgi:pimeloyl-ACP methyl ester carboxylesterase
MSTDVIPTPRSQALLLPSGRRLGIAEQGDPQGIPVLFFHGFVGSRLQCPPDGTIAGTVGVRLIAVDRPGIVLSDRAPGRHLLDWANDIQMLAEALHLTRFAILGWSAGAPHALVSAQKSSNLHAIYQWGNTDMAGHLASNRKRVPSSKLFEVKKV